MTTTNGCKIEIKGDDLTKKHIYAYGIGHVQNDIVSACWFNFLSYYLIQVRKISGETAGLILLIAQITDAVSTPIVGLLSDRTNTRCGQRTPWYIAGTILNIIGYTMIWEKCFFCEDESEGPSTSEFIYYIIFPPIMQMGWASVQVAHMALLPCISLNSKNKDKMCRIRTGFTFISQLMALGLSFLIFFTVHDKLLQYRILSYSVQTLGLIFTIIFLYYCREVPLSANIDNYFQDMKANLIEARKKELTLETESDVKDSQINRLSRSFEPSSDDRVGNLFKSVQEKKQTRKEESNKYLINSSGQTSSKVSEDEKDNSLIIDSDKQDMKDDIIISDYVQPPERVIDWKYWMSKIDFYIYLFVYMFVRLSINITSTMIPFYMELILGYCPIPGGGTRYEISIVLIISTCGSVFNSLLMQDQLEKRIDKKNLRLVLFVIAFALVSTGCIPLLFITPETSWLLFVVSFFFGAGFSIGLSSASYLVNDVVGSKGSKGAFVYGAYSFSDKLSSGLVLAWFLPLAKESVSVLKWSMPIFPPATIILSLLIVYFYGKANKDEPEEEDENDDNLNATNIMQNSKFTFIAA